MAEGAPSSAYPKVYPWIAQCLQDSVSGVADAYFDLAIRGALRDNVPRSAIAAAGASGGAAFYAALPEGDDRDRLSEAVGLLVAADWQPSLATGGAGGDLLSESTEQTKRSFAPAGSLREEWRERARGLIARCAFAPPSPIAGISLFAANGPSRAQEARWGERDERWRDRD